MTTPMLSGELVTRMATQTVPGTQVPGTPTTGAGGGDFRVLPIDVSTAAQNCNTTATEVDAQLQALKNYVMDLEVHWGGIAAQTFNALMADWDIYTNMLNQALQGISNGLRGNWVNYSTSEATNIANLKKVHGSLPSSPGARY